jgi:hypothetical protein
MGRRRNSWTGLTCTAISLAVVTALLAITPFVAVLEVHHLLAAADQDGHEHSDTDLCQWVQHHAGSSIQPVIPTVCSVPTAGQHELPVPALLISSALTALDPARGPPIS